MTLTKNYKVENNGIWILKDEIQSWKDHYESIANVSENLPSKMYYMGMADVLMDLLKTIEREKGD